MTRFVKSPKEVASGLLLVFLAAFFAWQAMELPMGRAIRMGPGYFPMILAGLLGLLGLVVLLSGLSLRPVEEEDETQRIRFSRWPWVPLGLVTLAVVVFGLGIRPLGLGPSMGLAVFICATASRRFKLTTGLVSAIVMVAFSWAVFIKGLGLPLPMLGSWLGGH